MKVYKIFLRHCSPKDSISVIHSYVLANSQKELMLRLDKEELSGQWAGDVYKVYDDMHCQIGKESTFEHMLRLRGNYFDPNADYGDAYYGLSFWGWNEGTEITIEQAQTLLDLGIAKDWR